MNSQYRVKHRISRIYLFSALFLLSCISSTIVVAQQKADPPVAIVNGVEIPYSAYDRARLTRLLNLGADPADTSVLDALEDDGIFLTLVDSELILQEAKKRGIRVSRDEAIEMLVADPPDYILAMFEGGHYNPSRLRELASKPRTILNYASRPGLPKSKIVSDWEEDINNLLRYYSIQESRRRLLDLLNTETPLTEEDITARYYAEKTLLVGSVVRVLHSTVPDSLCPVTEEEARTWFDVHHDEYAIPESRSPLSIILPINPSLADSTSLAERIERVKQIIETAPLADRLNRVEDALEDLPPNRIASGRTISPSAFPTQFAQKLAGARVGDLLGPYPVKDEQLLLYVVAETPSKDTIIRARHLLMRPSPEGGEVEIDGLTSFLTDLRDSIDSEEEFIASAKYYSVDERSGQNGGDLGYAGRGLFVPEFDSALFVAPVGKAIGPVKTRFGYHLIWVNARVARDLELRELRFPLQPSDEVVAGVMADAEKYASALRNGYPVESMLQEVFQRYPGTVVDSMTYLKRLEPYADGLAVGEFLFRSELDDVGVILLPFDRIGIIRFQKHWPGGTPQFEEIPEYPTAHARRAKQLDRLERHLEDMSLQITPSTLLGPIREIAPMAEVLELQHQSVPTMEDEDPTLLDSLVVVTQMGEVSGPVRGVHALYFLRLSERYGPDEYLYQKEIDSFSQHYRERYQSKLLEDLLMEARVNSEILDLRNSTLQLLGAHKSRGSISQESRVDQSRVEGRGVEGQ